MFCVQIERFEQQQQQQQQQEVTSVKEKMKQNIFYLKIDHNDEAVRIINHSCNPNCCLVEQEGRNCFRQMK